jgi:hypothetical protein
MFDNLLPAADESEEIGCHNLMETSFTVVKNQEAKEEIQVRVQYSDMEACSRESHSTFQIGYKGDELIVSMLNARSYSYSSGDPSPLWEFTAHLDNSYWGSSLKYVNLYDSRSDLGVTGHVRIPGECELTLKQFNDTNGATPECVNNVLDKFDAIEVSDY